PAPEQVDMEVVDGLPAPAAGVRHEPVAVVGDTFTSRDFRDRREHPPEPRPVLLGQLRGGRDVVARDDEDVGRRARGDVAERYDDVVLVDLRRADLARGDLAEKAVGVGGNQSPHGGGPPAGGRPTPRSRTDGSTESTRTRPTTFSSARSRGGS